VQIVESGSLTKGYKSKFPLFHKLFLSRVEKGDALAAVGLLWVAAKKMVDSSAKKTAPKGGFTIEWKNAAGEMHFQFQPANLSPQLLPEASRRYRS
jgi:hypothetical protein